MKRLIIVRHGDYTGRGGRDCMLNENGKSQMLALRVALLPYLTGGSVAMLSSDFPRNVQSAEILVGDLPITIEQFPLLVSGGDVDEKSEEACELIKQYEEVDTVCVITHQEYTEELPTCFMRQRWGMNVRGQKADYGKAWLIDMEKQTKNLLPQ